MNSKVLRKAWNHALKTQNDVAGLDEERARAEVAIGLDVFERVKTIVENQDVSKRAAFYRTIAEAACAGEDFSRVESIDDIGDIYARFIVRKSFDEIK